MNSNPSESLSSLLQEAFHSGGVCWLGGGGGGGGRLRTRGMSTVPKITNLLLNIVDSIPIARTLANSNLALT